MAKSKYIRDEDISYEDDPVASMDVKNDDQRNRVRTVWTHLQSLKNYVPMMGKQAETAGRTLEESEFHINRAFLGNSSKPLGRSIEGMSTVSNQLVNHLGANHPISQEVLASHAGAIAAYNDHVLHSAKAGN